MLKEYKSALLLKAVALLLATTLSVAVLFGASHCRYLTEKNLEMKYSAKAVPSIFMGETAVIEETLFDPPQWQSSFNETTANFTLSNAVGENTPPQQDIAFSLRVCVVEQQNRPDDEEDTTTLPISVSITIGGDSFESATHTLSQNTALNSNNMTGEFFVFNGQEGNELVFCLAGNNKSSIDFELTVHNLQSEYQKAYLSITRF